jgi:hypothetical protein
MIKHINVYRAVICTRQTLCSEMLGLHIKKYQMLFMIFVKQEQLTMPRKFLNAAQFYSCIMSIHFNIDPSDIHLF